jgi:hypothetical protein
MSEDQRKPWLEYPHIWKSEAAFWTYVRGSLRRGLWEKSPIKLDYKSKACEKPPEGYTGRAKTGAYCALTGEWTGKSKMEVDHCEGHKSLLGWEDILPFILHLIPPPDSLQLVDKEAHKVKSYAERRGISFEEALIDKEVISICKGDEKQWLLDNRVKPMSNLKLRKQQIREILEDKL